MKVLSKPKISVVMSVYNGMPYLKEAVRSILNQSYKNFEFIIVDDASTDKTWQYLKGIKDKQSLRSSSKTAGLRRVKLVRNRNNLGLASSLNKALKEAKGDYIARMDADDISHKRRLEVQLNFMRHHPQVDICGSWAKLINESGEVIGIVKKPATDKKIKKINHWIPGLIHPTWFAKKTVFENLRGYNPNLDMVEDYDFLIRAKKFKMANINRELILWRSPQTRRSQKNINLMYRKSLSLRWQYFKKGEFGLSYLPYLVRSLVTTYLFPIKLKIFFNKKAGLI